MAGDTESEWLIQIIGIQRSESHKAPPLPTVAPKLWYGIPNTSSKEKTPGGKVLKEFQYELGQHKEAK